MIASLKAKSALAVALWMLPGVAWSQENRLSSGIDSRQMAVLPGSVHPLAQAKYDLGPADPSQALRPITLVLKRSPAQQAALAKLLQDQQDPNSKDYHQWLTPQQFGERFGFSPADIAAVSTWLKSQGFTVVDVPFSRNMIVFSGAIQTVQTALRTTVHRYLVDGESHIANSGPVSLPAALAPLVLAVNGLDDFQPKAAVRPLGKKTPAKPAYTNPANGSHNLAPADFAVIYDILPAYQEGFTGSGQQIAVIGRCAIGLSDVQTFRATFSLPQNNPQLILASGSPDPGPNGVESGDCDEAYLDVEWAGGVASGATIDFIYATDVFYAAQYAITQNKASILMTSFGGCEQNTASSGVSAALESLAQQANAQGITWIASSGDSGAAACDEAFSPTGNEASNGLAVNFPASIPEVTAVGGTEFNDPSGNFWNSVNGSGGVSALLYIPEVAWNETASSYGLAASGGGLSVLYSNPTWQIGPGVPRSQNRAVPDLAMAAAEHDGYLIFENAEEYIESGTSAASASFASILAILNQYEIAKGFQSQPGQGNINPNLYRLAQSAPSAFHDITTGNNIVPCVSGTPDCTTGSFGFSAGPGYDLVTGLGSVDANILISHWANQSMNTTTTLSANPASFPLSGSVQLTATVSTAAGSKIPTGTVSFQVGSVPLGSVTLAASGLSATAVLTAFGSQFAAGGNTVTASYGGGPGMNGSSGTTAVTVTQPANMTAIIPSSFPDPVYQQPADADGYTFFFTLTLSEVNGVGTSLTKFTFDGSDYSSQIADFFEATTIAPHGSLSAVLRARNFTLPTDAVFQFGGIDANGSPWTQQFSVPLYGPQITAVMSLASLPATVQQNPSASSNCQWYQNLVVQESNGHNVQLQHLLTAGSDLSSQIQQYFGSTMLPAYGDLVADICWTGITAPSNNNFEVDGTDDTGQPVTATTSVLFDVPSTSGSVLAVGTSSLTLSVPDASHSTSAQIQVNVAKGQQWVATILPANQTTRWLAVSPVSGVGPGTINIVASGSPNDAASLANGAYSAMISIQSANSRPQFVNIPVTFTVSSSGLTLQQVFPHIASDNEWHTDIFVLNTSSTPATFSLVFHTDSGAPLLLDGNPQINNVTLPANGTTFFRTSPISTANDGWAELDSNAPLSGVVVFGREPGDGSYYEASVPLSAPYSSFTVPFDETESPLESPQGTPLPFIDGFAVTNTDPVNPTRISCTAYDSIGNVLSSALQVGPLNALEHTEFLIDQQFGPSLEGQQGTLSCQADTLVAAVELRAISSSPAVSSLPVMPSSTTPVSSNSGTLIFPHIASDSQWHTDIFVMNPGRTPATFSLVFHTDNQSGLTLVGSPETFNVALPANGLAFFRTSPTSTSNDGWAEVDSTTPLSGVVVYGRHGDDGRYYEASASLSYPYAGFTVPFDETLSPLASPFVDGFAVTNANSSAAAQIACTAYGSSGGLLGSGFPMGPLGPWHHTEFLVDQQFGTVLAGKRGTLACQSSTPVGAVELRAISSSPAVSSMPVIPSAAASAAASSRPATVQKQALPVTDHPALARQTPHLAAN
jgi:hypothetical protein